MTNRNKSSKSVDRPERSPEAETETARIVQMAETLKKRYAASPDLARANLIEMGILDSSGKLSDNYK